MPFKRATLTCYTPEAQGPDSWIEFVPLEIDQVIGDPTQRVLPVREEIVKRLLRWNWVDTEGHPYPQPKDEPGIIGVLSMHEYAVIRNTIWGWDSPDRLKN